MAQMRSILKQPRKKKKELRISKKPVMASKRGKGLGHDHPFLSYRNRNWQEARV
jgi:hypothetical protein